MLNSTRGGEQVHTTAGPPSDDPGQHPHHTRRRARLAWIAVAGLTVAATVASLVGAGVIAGQRGQRGRAGASGSASHRRVRLLTSSCTGPSGTLFVAEAGYDAVGIIDTATCEYTGTYNVGDTAASNQPTDTNYASTDEAIAVVGKVLYFADAGTSDVAVITSGAFATLPTGDYTPPETLIDVGFFPEDLAATPDGAQVWVVDTGPQTGTTGSDVGTSSSAKNQVPFTAISVITTTSNTVIGTVQLSSPPQAVAFSPNGQYAYVTTGNELLVIDVADLSVVGHVNGLEGAHGVAVSPDGQDVYVTDSATGTVSVIGASSLRVSRTIAVGELPWTVALSPSGATAYVADPDSDAVSVVDTSTGSVSTVTIAGDPESLALSPGGTTLWVGEGEGSHVAVVTTSSDTQIGAVELGFSGPQSGDGLEPTGLAFIG